MNYNEFLHKMSMIRIPDTPWIEDWHIQKFKEIKKEIKEEDVKEFLMKYYNHVFFENLKEGELETISEVFEVKANVKIVIE